MGRFGRASRRARGPRSRKVRVGQTETPSWQAGDALLPYGRDSFTTGMLEVEADRRDMGGGLGGL